MSEEHGADLTVVLVSLLKGVVSRDEHEARWHALKRWEPRVRDYARVLGLELVVAEDDGYAFLRQREAETGDGDGAEAPPRLVPRRPLSYPVSLLLALLRRRVAEHDAASGDARIVMSVEETREMLRTYLPESSDEARIADRIDAHLNTVAKLGFIRFLRDDENHFEIRRLINSFVTAEWLAEFERRLAEQPDE